MGESVEFETKPAFALPVGATIGGYSIRRVIGKGGFGITYEAFNRVTGKEVAIKEFFPTGIAWRDGQSHLTYSRADSDTIDWALRKFEDTTTTLCKLEHRNIVQVHDYVPSNDTGYMVMELLDGQTLQRWLEARHGPPGLDELRTLLDPVMEALTYVHGRGLVHRDIAPDNILITQSGRPVLIDFGSVSRDLSHARAATHAGTKGVWKRHYTAPEQIQANAWPTPQADIYSLGAVLYRALSGVEPADGDARKHESFLGGADPYRPLSERRPAGLPSKAAEAIDKALALRAESRFYSVTEFRTALEQRVAPPPPPPPPPHPPVQSQPPVMPPQGPPVSPPPGPSTAKWLVGGAVVVVLALIGGVLGGKAISDRAGQLQQTKDDLQRQRDEAARQSREAQEATEAARRREAEADRREAEATQRRDDAARAQTDAARREAEARQQRDDAARAQTDAARREAEAQAEQQAQADAARRAPSLQDRATSAVATFYDRHSYTPGDNLSSLAALYPSNGAIIVNGKELSGNGQAAELQRYYQKGRFTSFQIAVVPGTLAFDCDSAERCIVKGQTRASYQTEDNPTPRSSLSNFCLRLDLRGSPKVLSESAVKASKVPTCG